MQHGLLCVRGMLLCKGEVIALMNLQNLMSATIITMYATRN